MAKPAFIPLAAGVQTELADQLVTPGATLVSENVYSDQTGKAHVRFGADILSTASQGTLPTGGTLPVPWQLATLGGQLVRFNRAPIPFHTWAASPQRWVAPDNSGGLETFRRGPIKLDTTPVFAGTAQVSDGDVAVGTNAIVQVFAVDTGIAGTTGVAVAILDRTTRRVIFVRRGGGGSRGGHVVIVGNRAVVAYESAGSLQVDAYDLTTYTLAQQQTLGAVLPGTAIDMRAGAPGGTGNSVGILYRTVTTGQLRCQVVDATNLAVNSLFTPRTTAGVVSVPDLAFGWMQDFGAAGKFSVMIADSTNGLRTLWDLPAPAAGFSNATATHVLDAAATATPSGPTPGIRNLIGTTITNSATGVYRVLYEMTALNFKTTAEIRIAVWNGAASIGVQYRSVGIRSKFWQHAGQNYFLSVFDGTDQRTYFVLAMSNDTTTTTTTFSAPLAVALPRDAGGFTESISAPSAAAVDSDGAIYVAVTEETRTEELVTAGGTGTGTATRLLGSDLVRIRHPVTAETEMGKPIEFVKSLFTPGGSVGFFDSATYGLAGFAYYPPNVNAGTVGVVGGNLDPSASYAYRFVYAFMDRNGRIWRSAPSTPLLTGTDATKFSLMVTLDTLRLTDRGLASGQNAYWIEAYRTQGNAPGAYFLAAVVANDPTVHTLSFTDNTADVNLGEELYTDGNGVENQLLPSVSNCAVFGGRLIFSQAGTATLWYCVEPDFTNGLIFNEALTIDIDDPSDPITGMAVDGEHLFVFKTGKIFIMGGDGANALGQGQTYNYRLIDSDLGCTNAQSIVSGAEGVWFRSASSRAGIFRSTGGTPEYVGDGVRAYNSLTITSAVVVKDKTEIRWYSLEGMTLAWNWTTKSWSTNTLQPCLSATTGLDGVAGAIYARASDSFILSEATANSLQPYVEGGTNYLGRIRSPWYRLAGALGGWGRIKRIQGVGELPALHRTVVLLYRDMGFTPFQSASIVFGDTRPRWDWELRPAQEKMDTIMVEVQIFPYQPPTRAITGSTLDRYDGIDVDFPGGDWFFTNGDFAPGDVGAAVTISGGPAGKNGSYTILHVTDAQHVILSPLPGGGTGAFGVVATISVTPALVYTAGPGIEGVALLPVAKEGMDKLPASRRLA